MDAVLMPGSLQMTWLQLWAWQSSEKRWRIESCDAGMGETEYRLFRFGEFFCQTPTAKEAQQIILWNEIFRTGGKDGE